MVALAEQNFSVGNNATIVAIASKQEITRINFGGERVAALHYIGNEFHYDINESDIYLKVFAQDKPINFFVRTENGKTYKFILDVKDIPATQIFVGKQHNKKHTRSKRASLFRQNISQLVRVLKIEEPYLGFDFKRQGTKSKKGHMLMHSVLTASGKGLIGEKIVLSNISNEELNISNHDFIEPGIAAIYLGKNNLLPNEKTILIRIKRGFR